MALLPVVERSAPRISANELALYMVSSDTARFGIVRRAKAPSKPPIIRYRYARPPICTFLTDPNRRLDPLVAAGEAMRQRADDTSQSSLAQDDARQTIEVLHAIQRMGNTLSTYDFMPAPADQAKLQLGGVEVSVRADMLVHGSTRRQELYGAAILRMTQDDTTTDAARDQRREMGIYVATLARMHAEQNLPSNRTVANRLCMSIDVQHGEVFHAPDAIVRRTNDLESACRMIAAIWDQA